MSSSMNGNGREKAAKNGKAEGGELVVPGVREPSVRQMFPGGAALAAIPVSRMHNVDAIRRDALKLYKAARRGLIDSSELGRFAYASRHLADLTLEARVEPRVKELLDKVARIEAALNLQTE
jgi:hypothetical protein